MHAKAEKATSTFPENRLALSIPETATALGVGVWMVKEKLRDGTLKARKIGARTLIDANSVKALWENLPVARFAAPVDRKSAKEPEAA